MIGSPPPYGPEHRRLVGENLFPFGDIWPVLDEAVFLAPGSRVIGDVVLGKECSVWYNAVVRGDVNYVRIGDGSNVQDNATLHVTHDTNPLVIGSLVTIGHGAILHGCVVEDRVLIGMHATVLDRAVIGEGSMVGAGAVVPPGMVVPPGSLVVGVPARVLRSLRPEEVAELEAGPRRYTAYARANAEAVARARRSVAQDS